MAWFTDWWSSLMLIQQILFCIAIPATLLLLIQTILLLTGIGGGEGFNPSDSSGLDFDTALDAPDITHDALNPHHDGGFADGTTPGDFTVANIFTVQGIVAFLCIFSWTGIAGIAGGLNILVSLLIGFALGVLAMVGIAKLISLSTKLVQNGTINMKNLLGAKGSVYIQIPASQNGFGKVTVLAGERYIECDAVTEAGEMLKTNTPVMVVDLQGDVLVVEKVK